MNSTDPRDTVTNKYTNELMGLAVAHLNFKTALEMVSEMPTSPRIHATDAIQADATDIGYHARRILIRLKTDIPSGVSDVSDIGNAFIQLTHAMACLEMLTLQCAAMATTRRLEHPAVRQEVVASVQAIKEVAVKMPARASDAAEAALQL